MKTIAFKTFLLSLLLSITCMTAFADIAPIQDHNDIDDEAVEIDEEDDDDDNENDPYAANLSNKEQQQAEQQAERVNTEDDFNSEVEDFDPENPRLTYAEYAKVKTERKMIDLIARFVINSIFCFIIARFFYYPKSRRRDFFFTYLLVGFAIFMLIHLMSGESMETGIGMGLFAIFCIMRYRTESVPIREMTYLFVIIALAALNGMAWDISFKRQEFAVPELIAMIELVITNVLFLVVIMLAETRWIAKGLSSKYINYDKIDLIVPEKRAELIDDLKKRTGLDITSVTIGNIDFLKDMAFIKISYRDNEEAQELPQRMPKTF